jgi:hypothetical protein
MGNCWGLPSRGQREGLAGRPPPSCFAVAERPRNSHTYITSTNRNISTEPTLPVGVRCRCFFGRCGCTTCCHQTMGRGDNQQLPGLLFLINYDSTSLSDAKHSRHLVKATQMKEFPNLTE